MIKIKMTQKTIDDVKMLLDDGYLKKEVSKVLNLNKNTVSRICKANFNYDDYCSLRNGHTMKYKTYKDFKDYERALFLVREKGYPNVSDYIEDKGIHYYNKHIKPLVHEG